MSGYFDGLLIASGLASTIPATAAGVSVSPDAPGPTTLPEIDVEVPAPPPSPLVEPPGTPEPRRDLPVIAAESPVAPAMHATTRPTPSAPAAPLTPSLPEVDRARVHDVRGAPTVEKPGPTPALPAPPRDGRPAVGADAGLVAAAMQWVAANARRLDAPHTEPRAEPRTAAPSREPPIESADGAPPAVARPPAVPSGSEVARPVVAAVVRPSVVHAAAPDAYEPAARERAVARQVADPGAEPHAGQELVEVSIGAITLRVDAPAAPAAVRPLAPAPPPRQAAARARAGSGLARRALRRI